jgi:hypothetical protein
MWQVMIDRADFVSLHCFYSVSIDSILMWMFEV